FAATLLWALWSAQQTEIRRELQHTAHTLSVALDREIGGSLRELERIAETPSLRSGRLAEFHAYAAKIVAERRQFSNLVLFDLANQQLVNALVPFGPPLPVTKRALEDQVVTSGRRMVSDVIPNTVDGSPSIAIAVPVKVDGVLRAVLMARLEHEDLSRLLAEQQARTGGVAVILDRSERVVARSRDAGKFFGTEAPDHFKELLRSAPRGAAPSRSLEGNPVLTAWEKLPFGWTVAIGIPSGGQVASFANTIYALGALGFVLLVVSVLGVAAFSRRVRGELIEISGQTHRLSAGEPIPSRRFTFRELDDVYAAMRDASQRVAGLVGSLRNSEAVARERLAALEQGDKRKDAFLAMLAHELRNPLAPIRTAAETLRFQPTDPRTIARAREIISRQVMHLSRLVDDLLDVSRITQGKIVLHPILLDLRTVVSVSVHSAAALGVYRNQSILWDEPREPIWVEGDLVRLTQIVDNLLSNALKFSASGSQVNVWLETEEGQARLTVHDQGVGIAQELLDRIFDMFVQGDESLERSSGGLGLGLTLVRELARLHGGTVHAASEGRGQGATFTVRLPLSSRKPDRTVAPVESAPAQHHQARGRVLVVDDNQDAAEALAWILEPLHEVQIAYDGRAAVERAQAFHPDVVLLDIGLPVLNGYQVAEELRKSPETVNSVIIAITGYGQSSDRERALQSGFDFHLVKPAEPTQVLRMIDDALQHRNESRTMD
ncbi:MAG TPA: ATP-binding protein, partial [Burkholderiaceae bacterium]|nr:ATP-binding protein [Burkholderiaceae bacterium]